MVYSKGYFVNHTTIIVAVGLALAAALPAAPAEAQNGRSFVSGHGSDAAACTLAAPCRTLAAAFAATNAGGEIDVLDPAGYGALTINKAISIVNDGVGTAGVIVPSGGIGITITAGTNDAVSLRGLSIEGAGVGLTGIQFNAGKSLTVENCVIRHVTADGIDFLPPGSSRLSVSNSVVADNSGTGIAIVPSGTGTTVTAVFNRIQVNNNAGSGGGIRLDTTGAVFPGTVNAVVYDSIAQGNTTGPGFSATNFTFVGKPTTMMIFHSVAADNSIGILGQNSAFIRVANSMVTGNATGWQTDNATVLSYGDNYIDGNIGSETAPPSIARK